MRVHQARLRSCLAWTFVKRGLPLLCFAFAVSIVVPMVAFGCLVCASGIAAAELLFVFFRERRAMRSALLDLHASGQPMGDLLLAWQESHGRGAQSDMAAWLSDLLAREVAGLEPGIERRWLRRGLGASRYLAPVAVALALMWAMRPSVAMPWFGMGGGSASSSGAGGGDGQGGSGSNSESQGGGETDAQDPQEAPTQPRADAPPNQPEEPQPSEPQEQETQAPPQPPAPFLDLPANAEVVVPELTRDGETRRAMAMQASVAAGGAAETQGASSGQGGGGSDEASRTKQEEFERAQERALQSRRVPERERAIVRSFFEALRGASK